MKRATPFSLCNIFECLEGMTSLQDASCRQRLWRGMKRTNIVIIRAPSQVTVDARTPGSTFFTFPNLDSLDYRPRKYLGLPIEVVFPAENRASPVEIGAPSFKSDPDNFLEIHQDGGTSV